MRPYEIFFRELADFFRDLFKKRKKPEKDDNYPMW